MATQKEQFDRRQMERELRSIERESRGFARVGKKTYYDTPAELHYRELVHIRKERSKRPYAEQRFFEIYGKWPTALELAQAAPYLKKRRNETDD